METTVSINNVEVKSYTRKDNSTGTIYSLSASDGKKYTTFSDTVGQRVQDEIKNGAKEFKFKYEEKQQGQYTNYIIKEIANDDGTYPVRSQGAGRAVQGKADPEKLEIERKKNSSIVRQVAMKGAVELIVAGKREYGDLRVTFDDLMELIKENV